MHPRSVVLLSSHAFCGVKRSLPFGVALLDSSIK